jgi:hypothetical protein
VGLGNPASQLGTCFTDPHGEGIIGHILVRNTVPALRTNGTHLNCPLNKGLEFIV